jgi:hypothetical protein
MSPKVSAILGENISGTRTGCNDDVWDMERSFLGEDTAEDTDGRKICGGPLEVGWSPTRCVTFRCDWRPPIPMYSQR